MGESAGCTFVQWARYGQLSPGRLLLVWTSLREWPTPQFLLPSISNLPMDPSGRQTGWFCILHLKDLSMNDLSAVRCKSILHCISWLNLFSQYMNSKYFQWSFRSERGRNLSREKWCSIIWTACSEISFHSASASTSLGTTLVTDYVNFEYKCRFTAWFARVASHSNPADQPSRQIFLRSGYVIQKGLHLSCQFSPWFARVASHSNPSDEPSRMNFEAPWLRQASKVELVLPEHLSHWGIIGCSDT